MSEQRNSVLATVAANVGELPGERLIVAVDGVDTSGKTYFADELGRVLESTGRVVIRASIDGFHNPRKIRYAQGEYSPEGYYQDSFNLDGFIKDLLLRYKNRDQQGFLTAVHDVRTDNRVENLWTEVPEEAILIIDGIFLMRPELERYWDYKIFLDVPFEEVIRRAKLRDGDLLGTELEIKYQRRYIPAQKKYLQEINPKVKADKVINNQDINAPFIVAK
ncbi:MAG: uridine kinase [Candidatus Saccharibacteria bacterium]|nr:uridine kinase [Candidatus Saccharibacteria bacterium]